MLRLFDNARERREKDARSVRALQMENEALRADLNAMTRAEEDARYLATHDSLTGLANRSLLMDRYIQAAAHAQRNERAIAVLALDIDNFKHINDQYGHLAGDRLLQNVGQELQQIARAGDTASRHGGDEFVVLLASIANLDDAQTVAQKVRTRITDTLRVDGISMDVTASCGIAMYPEQGDNWSTLMQAADVAMYRDKPQPRVIAA